MFRIRANPDRFKSLRCGIAVKVTFRPEIIFGTVTYTKKKENNQPNKIYCENVQKSFLKV